MKLKKMMRILRMLWRNPDIAFGFMLGTIATALINALIQILYHMG
jgi:hypothetical protein